MAPRTFPVFDTSVFADYADQIEERIVNVLFPTVVFYELIATSLDAASLKKFEKWRIWLNNEDRILNPTITDWWETSKAIRRLYLMKNSQPSKLRTLRNDALIARLAVRHNGFVVTHDIDDFQMIQRVMPGLRVVSATDFFRP
ncbi:MAG: type II toxin-antitoxin system VapC family toxin [Acidobacteria bacterium]|nr:type II toxin-antitoxin system VapC family toxin [Acidobacteriota bacterium]